MQMIIDRYDGLASGRRASINQYTVFAHLLQRARRAGATAISVEHDAARATLDISDNGVGHDPTPPGMACPPPGVLLLGCNGQVAISAEMTTARMTRVEGRGLAYRVARLVRGFPLPVLFNAIALSRGHCQSARTYEPTEIGQVYLTGAIAHEAAARYAMYLDGLLVDHRDYYCETDRVDIIHIDPRRFHARVGDGTELIDAPRCRAEVLRVLRRLRTTRHAAR